MPLFVTPATTGSLSAAAVYTPPPLALHPRAILSDAHYLYGPTPRYNSAMAPGRNQMVNGAPHPSVTLRVENQFSATSGDIGLAYPGPDYFRTAAARYIAGSVTGEGYVLPPMTDYLSTIEMVSSSAMVLPTGAPLYVGFNIITWKDDFVSPAGGIHAPEKENFNNGVDPATLIRYMLNNGETGYPSSFFPYAAEAPVVPSHNVVGASGEDYSWTAPPGFFGGVGAFRSNSQRNILIVKPANTEWYRDAQDTGVAPNLQHLADAPFGYVWRAFVHGKGFADMVSSSLAPLMEYELDKFPGILSDKVVNTSYMDHRFQLDLPIPGQISAQTHYHYYDEGTEALHLNNSYIKETMLPNYYLTMTFAKQGGNFMYGDLYTHAPDLINDILSLDQVVPWVPAPSLGIALGHISAGPQNSNSLLSKLKETDFSLVSGSAVGANQHIGFDSKLLGKFGGSDGIDGLSSPNQINEINEWKLLFPYGIEISFNQMSASALFNHYQDIENASRTGDPPGWLNKINSGPAWPSGSLVSDYFLYEIMKANIFNYNEENRSLGYLSGDGLTDTWPQVYQPYHLYDFGSKTLTTETAFSGLPMEYLVDIPGVPDSAREPHKYRCIDVPFLFLNADEMGTNLLGSNTSIMDPPGSHTAIYGEDNRYPFGTDMNYSGFLGQSKAKLVADDMGMIVGKDFSKLAPGTSMGASTLPYNRYPLLGYGNSMPPRDAFKKIIFGMAQYVEARVRSYEDILKGTLAPSDVIAYKIEKYTTDDAGIPSQDPVQTFYFPNTGEVINYFDAQVFFGRRYKYKVWAYVFVIGNQYNYSDMSTVPSLSAGSQWSNLLGPFLGFGTEDNTGAPGDVFISEVDIRYNISNETVAPTPAGETQHQALPAPDFIQIQDWTQSAFGENQVMPGLPFWADLASRNINSFNAFAGNDNPYSEIVSTEIPSFYDSVTGYFDYSRFLRSLETKLSDATGVEWRVRFLELMAETHPFTVDHFINIEGFETVHLEGPDAGEYTGEFVSNEAVASADIKRGIGYISKGDGTHGRGLVIMAPAQTLRNMSDGQINTMLDAKLASLSYDNIVFGDTGTELGIFIVDGGMIGREGYGDPGHLLPHGAGNPVSIVANYGLTRAARFKTLMGVGDPVVPIVSNDDDDIFSMTAISSTMTDWAFLFGNGPHGANPTIHASPTDPSMYAANVTVSNFQSLKIVEVPYAELPTMKVIDLPPVFPQVDIFPIKGKPNQIKLFLNQSNYKKRFVPAWIEPEDEALFNEVRESQGMVDFSKGLLFAGDDTKVNYEVFRTDVAPLNYGDFSGKRIKILPTETEDGLRTTTASMLDKIKPNIEYYYCFRAIDKNGFLSIPSPVLKVHMVDDNGRMYPIIEPYDFPITSPRSTSKPFRRYLEIGAAMGQTAVNLQIPPPAGSIMPSEPPVTIPFDGAVWASDTTFKLRITSKDTGKKMDININFQMSASKNPDHRVADPPSLAQPEDPVSSAPLGPVDLLGLLS